MIVFCEGSKGGTGKSLLCALALDYFINSGIKPMLIDTDTSNPDVFKAYRDHTEAKTCKTDTEDQWADFLTMLDENREKNIVVNCGARNQESIQQWGETISAVGIDHKTLWVINAEKDSVILLKEYVKVVDPTTVTVVKNGFFGKIEAFEQYDTSKIKTEHKFQEIYVDKMPVRTETAFYSDRRPVHLISESLTFGQKLLFNQWLNKQREIIAEALK